MNVSNLAPVAENMRDILAVVTMSPWPTSSPIRAGPDLETAAEVPAWGASASVRHRPASDYLDAFSRGVRALHGGRLPWLLGGPPYSDAA